MRRLRKFSSISDADNQTVQTGCLVMVEDKPGAMSAKESPSETTVIEYDNGNYFLDKLENVGDTTVANLIKSKYSITGDIRKKHIFKDDFTASKGFFLSNNSGITEVYGIGDLVANTTNLGSRTNGNTGLLQKNVNMESVDCSDWIINKPTSFDQVFNGAGTNKLASIKGLHKLNSKNFTSLNRTFQGYGNNVEVEDLNLGGWDTSNVTDMAGLFQSCKSLKNVGSLSKWKTSNVTDMSYMFNNCNSLESVGDLSGWNTRNVTTMLNMFNCCHNLKSIGDVSRWDTSNVTTMTQMFNECYQLEELNVSNWNTSNVTDMSYMFGISNSTMNELGIPDECYHMVLDGYQHWNVSNVVNMRYMFQKMHFMEEFDLTSWDISNVLSMQCMFDMSSVSKYPIKLKKVKMGGMPNANLSCPSMFISVHTNGEFWYNKDYDYSKIIAVLPSTWTAVPCTKSFNYWSNRDELVPVS